MIKESETDSLWIFELTTPEGRVKKCILRAVGAGQQMRGINIDNQRPDMAVDDVEDNENTESELLQKKLDRWIFGPFLKRSEEHTSELQSLMRISYAVFCLKKKNKINKAEINTT